MRLPTQTRFFQASGYIFDNFAVPIVFFITFRGWGAKTAISFVIGVTIFQLAVSWILKKPLSPFFIIAAVFTISFGGIDLIIPDPKFFRLEPFVQNLVMGLLFLSTVFTNTPLIARFAGALPAKLRPDFSRIGHNYLKRLTLIWAVYLLVKSFIFLYLALNVDLGSLIVLRPVIGGGTLLLLVVGEMIYRKWLHRPA